MSGYSALLKFREPVIHMEGIYHVGGTKAICDLLGNQLNNDGECIIEGYYKESQNEFKKYRHHFNCSWGKINIGTTYINVNVLEKPVIWLFKCKRTKFTTIEEPYNYLVKLNNYKCD